ERGDRRVAQGAEAGGPLEILQQGELAEMAARAEPPQPLLGAVNVLNDFDFTRGNDVEAAGDLTLPNDRLAGVEAHRHDGIASSHSKLADITAEDGAGPPVQDECHAALPRWHVGQEQAAREDGRGPAVQSHASHLGEAIATAEQRDFAKALELDRPERLAADLRQDVARDLAALGEGDQQHRRVGIARWARNGGVVANRVHGWPSVDAAELVALDPAAHQG